MDSLKDRYFIRFIEDGKEYRFPLCKGRTILRIVFGMFFGRFQYVEIANESYLDKRSFKKKKDKDGNLVRGFGDSKRVELFGKTHERTINKFREGLFDPETSEEIMRLLFEISKNNKTIIMATHDYEIIKKYPARTIKCVDTQVHDNSLTN